MIKKNNEYTAEQRACGGSTDIFEVRHRFTKNEVFGKTRLVAEIMFEPGNLIPLHAHKDDVEIFLVLEGNLVSISEDGAETPFNSGDYMVTGGGGTHSIRNNSDKPAKLLAIIIE